MKAEIDSKVERATGGQLRALYEQQRSTRADSEPLPSFETLEPRLLATQAQTARADRQQAFFDELMAKAKVRIDLAALGRPALRFAARGPARGPKDAPVTIVEYVDFENPLSAQAHGTVESLLREFPDRLRLISRQNPQSEQGDARQVAVAALCAEDQARYWDYRKALFSDERMHQSQKLHEHAQRLGLDLRKFSDCLLSLEKASIVQEDIQEARDNGFEGVTGFSVNGTRLAGAPSIETFRRLIRFELP
jgi:hypothetical protein